jgi:hypothetical protein
MKTALFILLFSLISFTIFAEKTLKGDSNSNLDQYQITQIADNLFELTYSNSDATFTIEVCQKEDECCYLVRGEKIEMMYLCDENGFGVRKMPASLKKLETSSYKNLVESQSFQQQSLISSSGKNEKQALGLIACYFPGMINSESYRFVFNNLKDENRPELTIQN